METLNSLRTMDEMVTYGYLPSRRTSLHTTIVTELYCLMTEERL